MGAKNWPVDAVERALRECPGIQALTRKVAPRRMTPLLNEFKWRDWSRPGRNREALV